MKDMLSALVTSRKAWVLLLAVIGVVVMNVAGRVTGEQTIDVIKWLVSAWFGAVALEDAAEKHGTSQPVSSSESTTTVNTVAAEPASASPLPETARTGAER